MAYEADEVIVELQQAIEEAEAAEGAINGEVRNGTTDMVGLIARLKSRVESQIKTQLQVSKHTQQSRASAQRAMVGTNTDAEAIGFLSRVIEDSEDNIGKLQRIVELLDTISTQIIQAYSQSNEESAGKLRSAVGYLNGHISSI